VSYEPINVLVTAIGGSGHGEQILKALRMADPGRYRIFGADINPNCPQFSLVDHAIIVPPASDPKFIDVVLAICRKFKILAVFHGCEPELRSYSAARQQFFDAGVLLPINNCEVINLCMDKCLTGDFLSQRGFSPPVSRLVTTFTEALHVAPFPLIVKPHIGTGASKDCFVLQDPRELQAILDFLKVGTGNPLLIQEYVGTPESEFTVGVLHDLDGQYINSIAIRRELKSALNLRISVPNQTGRLELGPKLVVSSGISMGEVGKFPEVTEVCKRIALELDVRGAINIQGRLTSDGFKVFEINPRFSGTTSLRALMGYNEPDILLRHHLAGERITPDFPYRSGMVLRSLSESVASTVAADAWEELVSL